MWILFRLLVLLLLPVLAWGQALHQEKVGFYVANKAGEDCSQATLAAADAAAVAAGQILVLPPNDRFGASCQWTITGDMTIDSPVFFSYSGILPTPVLFVADDVTATLASCPVVWGDYYIADANGTTTGTLAYGVSCPQCSTSGPNNWVRCEGAFSGGGGAEDLTDNPISDLLDVDATVNATDNQILVGNDAVFVGRDLPVCVSSTHRLHFDGDLFSCVTDQTGGSATLQSVFEAGDGTIDGADCATKPLTVLNDGDDSLSLCIESGVPKIIAECNGGSCPMVLSIPANQTLTIEDLESGLPILVVDPDAASTQAMYQFGAGYRLTKSIEWPADAMIGDGTECNTAPTDETIGGGPARGLRCPMTTAETDGTITGIGVTLPGDFDKTSDAMFRIKAYLITDLGAGTWHGTVAITCVGPGEVRAYGTAVGLDLTPESGDSAEDEIHDTAAAVVDTDTTGANCDPGDTLYWEFISCDTDATPSTGCTSSAGFEQAMSIFSVKMEYKANSLSE